MVVGGEPVESSGGKVELIDLSGQSLSCPSIPDFPIPIYGSVGTFINGKALVCGGSDGDYKYRTCYSYNVQVSFSDCTTV